MTYNVFGGMLNLAQLNSTHKYLSRVKVCTNFFITVHINYYFMASKP